MEGGSQGEVVLGTTGGECEGLDQLQERVWPQELALREELLWMALLRDKEGEEVKGTT